MPRTDIKGYLIVMYCTFLKRGNVIHYITFPKINHAKRNETKLNLLVSDLFKNSLILEVLVFVQNTDTDTDTETFEPF